MCYCKVCVGIPAALKVICGICRCTVLPLYILAPATDHKSTERFHVVCCEAFGFPSKLAGAGKQTNFMIPSDSEQTTVGAKANVNFHNAVQYH